MFPHVLLELQHPYFKLLTWTAEDVAAYTEEARTLGAPLEAGEELFTDLKVPKCACALARRLARVTTIVGDCGNGRSGSFSKFLNVEVMAGDYIAVEVAEGCTTEGNATVVCPFLPVAATTDETSRIWHSVENRTRRVRGLLIQIKADIYPCKNIFYTEYL